MDQVKGFVGFLVGAIVLFYLSVFADDLQFSIGKFHEELHNDNMAIHAYEIVIHDYGNKIAEAKQRLAKLGVHRYRQELKDEKEYEKFKKKRRPPPKKDK